ncbi:uncharacterized protein LOC131023541 [Salvia miltiorrhiza]|uniref:uncharacterized protein LOC131023541 n=1 Tax=Salvia miltiorrhiza TaxID=226208 RepID=UPI0025AD2FC2|nr:uncharacterized protein LOC131023541 [Salvia miltiorrhiza]
MEIVVGGGGGGGGGEKLYSQNLQDFLRIKEEDHWRNLNQSTSSSSGGGARRSSSGLTLSAVLSDKIGQPPPAEEPLRRVESNRTLLDIIREDQTAGGLGRGRDDGRRSWRHLKDKIRLRRRARGSAWPTAAPTPSSDSNNHHQRPTETATQHHSFRFSSITESGESTQSDSISPIPLRNPRRSIESASERFEPSSSRQSTTDGNLNEERRIDAVEEAPEQPVRMSLMALLAENDRQMGYESSAYVMDEEEMGGSTSTSGKGVEYENCCVCMVRHKGAAFIPCGHTFCRLCSRELWVQRGNCPLCNNFIVEILDIF